MIAEKVKVERLNIANGDYRASAGGPDFFLIGGTAAGGRSGSALVDFIFNHSLWKRAVAANFGWKLRDVISLVVMLWAVCGPDCVGRHISRYMFLAVNVK